MIQIDMEMPDTCWDCAFICTTLKGEECQLLEWLEKEHVIEDSVAYFYRDEKCPLKLVETTRNHSKPLETTRNISGRNPIDKFVCEKCGFMIDGWTAFNFEDETDDRFDYEFAFKFCPDCGRKVEK